jgi:mitosis inhibitor protein kinase SWE1
MHLDLKPDNVFITSEGVLKIGDFGLALPWPAPEYSDAEGDRRYLGPEVLQGQFDKSADVFALGLTTIEMACNIWLPDNGLAWTGLRNHAYLPMLDLTRTDRDGLPRDDRGFPSDANCVLTIEIPKFLDDEYPDFFRIPENKTLVDPPSFMVNKSDPWSLDSLVRWMLTPEPIARPTIGQVLASGGLAWVAGRRRCPATVYEGYWGPADPPNVPGLDEDSAMTGVENNFI